MPEIWKTGSEYHAGNTYQILGVPDNNFEYVLRGIHNCQIESSLVIDVREICRVYLSVFSKDKSPEKTEHQIRSKEKSLESLMSGWKFRQATLPELRNMKYSA